MTTTTICIAKIVGPHGVHGSVRVHVFSDDPEGLSRYKKLLDGQGKSYTIKKLRLQKGEVVIVKFEEISTRNEAELARGTELFVDRDQLPDLEEEEFYINDLIGLEVRNRQGDAIGVVKSVENHGAGDFLVIVPYLKTPIPFTKVAVPEVHIADKYIVIDESLLDEGEQ